MAGACLALAFCWGLVPQGRAFRRGLALRSDWIASPLRLEQLCADGAMDKVTKDLTKAAEARPSDPDVALALAMQLFFSSQRDRAGIYFNRVAMFGGNDEHLLDSFLPQPELAEGPAN